MMSDPAKQLSDGSNGAARRRTISHSFDVAHQIPPFKAPLFSFFHRPFATSDFSAAVGIHYRSDIDGLRAIAILSVVLCHAEIPGFSGGYVGVDVFFVISGYLITSILLRAIDTGTFSLLEFYKRRILRILPALTAMLILTLIVGGLLLTPSDLARLGYTAVAAALMVPNFVFWRSSGYFAPDAHEIPLLHTWSLGVEEQFYLLFPLLLLLLARTRWRVRLAVVATLAAGSLALSAIGVLAAPNATFYLMPTRGWELLLGAMIALAPRPRLLQAGLLSQTSCVAGLALILYSVFTFDHNTPFPGPAALLPTIGAGLILLTAGTNSWWLPRLLSTPQFVFFGAISYSLYLWHNPVFAFYRYHALAPLSAFEQTLLIALSIIIAIVSWRFIELPFRRPQQVIASSRVFANASVAIVSVVCLGVVALYSHGVPWRFNADRLALIAENERVAEGWPYPSGCGNYSRNSLAKMDQIQYCLPQNEVVSWRGDKTPEGLPIALAWGDSNIEQLYPAFEQINHDSTSTRRIVMATYGGCPPLLNVNSRTPGSRCPEFNASVLARALRDDVDTVLIGASWTGWLVGWPPDGRDNNLCGSVGRCTAFASSSAQRAFMRSAINATLEPLARANKQIVLVLPFPTFDKPIAAYVTRRLSYGLPLDVTLAHDGYAKANGDARALLLEAASTFDAQVLDPVTLLCRNEMCPIEKGNVALYKDRNHISNSTAALFTQLFHRTIDDGGELSTLGTAPRGFVPRAQ